MDPLAVNVYEDVFDPDSYTKRYVSLSDDVDPSSKEMLLWQLSHLHGFYAKPEHRQAGYRILEYGGGPGSIYPLISAVPCASEIIFAEYAEQNRRKAEMWKNKEAGATDFSPLFRYVVETLEGNEDPSSHAAKHREEKLRSLLTDIVPCDITKEEPIDDDVKRPFDVVSTHYCLICACKSIAEYREGLRRLSHLLCPGGMIVMSEVVQSTFYELDDQNISTLSLDSRELVLDCLYAAGFSQIDCKSQKAPATELTPWSECLFITAKLGNDSNESC
jgi:hypothetical protein